MTSIFLTGATGYIGGQVLHELTQSHPEYRIAALIRDSKVAQNIAASFVNVRTVVASLDDVQVVEEETSKANVVLHLASNKHVGSFEAIQRGLAKRPNSSFWIQVSGASALAVDELADPNFKPGQPSDTVFDDYDGIDAIRSLVRAHPTARVVDNFLLDVAKKNPSIKTALVLPPIIYGVGEGPGNQRSIQVPSLAKDALERGNVVRLGAGEGRWGNIHIHDLGRLISSLAEAGANGKEDAALWGENGIYLSGIGEIPWCEISERVGKAAHKKGLISTAEVQEIGEAEADKILPRSSVFLASNARSKARRASELLGWKPKEESLESNIPKTVTLEAERLKK